MKPPNPKDTSHKINNLTNTTPEDRSATLLTSSQKNIRSPPPLAPLLALPAELRQQILLETYKTFDPDSLMGGYGAINVKQWTKNLELAFPTIYEDVEYVCQEVRQEVKELRWAIRVGRMDENMRNRLPEHMLPAVHLRRW